jgi:hypothetical protein
MIDTCEELVRLETDERLSNGIRRSQARIRVVARMLAENLLPRTGGIASFAAAEILTSTREALEILKTTAVQRLFASRSVWGAVSEIALRYLRERVPVNAHANRAKEGQVILAWLADRLPAIEGSSGRLVDGQEPVISSAYAWLEASLALVQQ